MGSLPFPTGVNDDDSLRDRGGTVCHLVDLVGDIVADQHDGVSI